LLLAFALLLAVVASPPSGARDLKLVIACPPAICVSASKSTGNRAGGWQPRKTKKDGRDSTCDGNPDRPAAPLRVFVFSCGYGLLGGSLFASGLGLAFAFAFDVMEVVVVAQFIEQHIAIVYDGDSSLLLVPPKDLIPELVGCKNLLNHCFSSSIGYLHVFVNANRYQ
jgi:hypothetical protein